MNRCHHIATREHALHRAPRAQNLSATPDPKPSFARSLSKRERHSAGDSPAIPMNQHLTDVRSSASVMNQYEEVLRMTKRLAVLGLVLLLATTGGVLGIAKKATFEGEGTRINVLSEIPVVITADQACWVRHGVTGGRWPGSQPDLKDEAGDRSIVSTGRVTFELFIDGEPIKLQVQMSATPGDDPGSTDRPQLHYVQFEPYHFEPGTYEFVGVWIAKNPNNPLADVSPFIRVVTLTVLEASASAGDFKKKAG